jgi:hypothetical protein
MLFFRTAQYVFSLRKPNKDWKLFEFFVELYEKSSKILIRFVCNTYPYHVSSYMHLRKINIREPWGTQENKARADNLAPSTSTTIERQFKNLDTVSLADPWNQTSRQACVKINDSPHNQTLSKSPTGQALSPSPPSLRTLNP